MKEPIAIIKDGMVVNANELRKYWAERQEFNWRIQYGRFLDIQRETLYASEKRYNEILGQDSPPKVVEHIHRTSDMGRKEFALLRKHERALKYLMGKQTEKEKPKAQSKRFGYRGIK